MEVHGICNSSLLKREKVVRLHQALRNFIFGDAEISLVVIQLGVTRLKKTGFMYLLAVVWRKGEKGCFDLVCGRLSMIELMVVLLTYFYAWYGFSSMGEFLLL